MFFKKKNILRKHFHFYGQVTGVGFRYRTKKAADLYGLTGWVRNTSDDMSVEAEVQGTQEQIDSLLTSYANSRWIEITRIEAVDMTPVDGEHGFELRY